MNPFIHFIISSWNQKMHKAVEKYRLYINYIFLYIAFAGKIRPVFLGDTSIISHIDFYSGVSTSLVIQRTICMRCAQHSHKKWVGLITKTVLFLQNNARLFTGSTTPFVHYRNSSRRYYYIILTVLTSPQVIPTCLGH